MQQDRIVRPIALAYAGAFLLATIMGVVPNPLVGHGALFHTNAAHNLVHLATALGFATVAMIGTRATIRFMQGFGVVYLAVGVLGFFVIGEGGYGYLLGLVHINALDNYLHLGLGAAILATGVALARREDSTGESPAAASAASTVG
ncbi:MAG: DUF4383 domain-containing protein [Myxococcales bacterium]|nr:MAG: DUF4383 domain-containing protein [Myxococcales bacterium]